MPALSALLSQVSSINVFNSISAMIALKEARRRRDELRSGFDEVVMVHENLMTSQRLDTLSDVMQASWMVAGLSHRLATVRTAWIQISNELDQKMALTITILGVYLACISLVIAVVSLVVTFR